MVEIYISWVKGLPQDKEALNILKNSDIISGIELSNVDNQICLIKEAGLKVSLHTPARDFLNNLSNPNLMNVFDSKEGPRILSIIRDSESPVVGFHLGFSALEIYKMKDTTPIPKNEGVIVNKDDLIYIITKNVSSLEQKINQGLLEENQKYLVLEMIDYGRKKPINWKIQSNEVRANKKEILETIKKYGVNSGLLHVTEPSFLEDVLNDVCIFNLKPVGLLFDIAHNLISANSKRYEGKFKGTNEDYFSQVINASDGRTYQIHVNVPSGNEKTGYMDNHLIFKPGKKQSDLIMELTKYVFEQSPELLVTTLEMDSGLEPVKHVKKMIEQANYIKNKLFKK